MMNELSQTLIFKPSKQAKHATFPQIRKNMIILKAEVCSKRSKFSNLTPMS